MRTASAPEQANVSSLDDAIILSRRHSVWSSHYSRRRFALCEYDLRRLSIMEALLYDQGGRVTGCSKGDLHHPETRFTCYEGDLWYYFSRDRQKFVLTDFQLVSSGGGFTSSAYRSGYLHFRTEKWCDREADIAARLACALTGELRSTSLAPAWFHETEGRPLTRTQIGGANVGDARASYDVVDDIVGVHALMSAQMAKAARAMPAWSMLGRTMIVTQQLASPYARAIFTGEALCRLGGHLGPERRRYRASHRVLFRLSHETVDNVGNRASDLMRESAAIIGAVYDGFVPVDMAAASRHFRTAWLMDADMMADVRRLALVRAEMVMRLGIALSLQASKVSHGRKSWPNDDFEIESHGRLLRRYSLLSEFALLSRRYFEGEAAPALSEYPEDLLRERKTKETDGRHYITALFQFEASTRLVADHFVGCDGKEEGHEVDMASMHDRLITIVSQILNVNRGTTPPDASPQDLA